MLLVPRDPDIADEAGNATLSGEAGLSDIDSCQTGDPGLGVDAQEVAAAIRAPTGVVVDTTEGDD